MSGCSGNCSSCGESCSDRKPESLLAEPNKKSNVKKVIAVVSGKGGVGKSTVTSMLAVAMQKLGYKTAILDADVTGPSIPRAFGLHEQIVGSDDGMIPAETPEGVKVMSINLLLPNETDPVIWRGPVIGGAVKQFWTDVCWGDVDYMFVDLPPGTGDVLPKICPDIGAHFRDLPNFAGRSGPPHKSRTKKLQAGAASKARGM